MTSTNSTEGRRSRHGEQERDAVSLHLRGCSLGRSCHRPYGARRNGKHAIKGVQSLTRTSASRRKLTAAGRAEFPPSPRPAPLSETPYVERSAPSNEVTQGSESALFEYLVVRLDVQFNLLSGKCTDPERWRSPVSRCNRMYAESVFSLDQHLENAMLYSVPGKKILGGLRYS